MFPHPRGIPPPRRGRRHLFWDQHYSYPDPTSHLPFDDLSISQPSSPPSLPYPSTPTHTPTDLPSRVHALNRRAAIVSASLKHLTEVVKPLETTKPEDLSSAHLADMWTEGGYLESAMGEFQEQMDEVWELLRGLVAGRERKRERVQAVEEGVEWWGREGVRMERRRKVGGG